MSTKFTPSLVILAFAIIIIGGFFLFSEKFSAPVLPTITSEMTLCQTNSDCQIITSPSCCPCPMIALNNSSASQLFETKKQTYCTYMNEKMGGIACPAIYCGTPTNATATCVNNVCKATANDLQNY